jgi:hypothetical protein
VENLTIDFTDTVAKYNRAYAETVRVPEAVRAHMAAAVEAERDRLTAELQRTKPAPAPPAPQPKRKRRRSLDKICEAAQKVGAPRVIVDAL